MIFAQIYYPTIFKTALSIGDASEYIDGATVYSTVSEFTHNCARVEILKKNP